jgi:hypothetical protein
MAAIAIDVAAAPMAIPEEASKEEEEEEDALIMARTEKSSPLT